MNNDFEQFNKMVNKNMKQALGVWVVMILIYGCVAVGVVAGICAIVINLLKH